MQRLCTMLLVLIVCFSSTSTAVFAQTPTIQADGQDYIVKPGDSLVKIAAIFYGQARAWRTIFDATNAKAAADPSYARIADPNRIWPGQKLWIPSQPASSAQPDPQALSDAYARAVKDAEVAEPGEISRNLIAITEWEPNLVWQTESEQRKVLMVTWTSYTGYNDKVGQATTLDATRVVWVTAAPEVRNFCRAYAQNNPSADLDLRLRQLLGLPPNDQKTTFVEFWVDPQDTFRPAPDPEITDHEAELDFRRTGEVTTTGTYETWFNQLREASYVAPGYPWTRLGYTYDWGNPNSEVGMSEFVIQGGATIKVAAVYPTHTYCN
jgi:LysM domain